MRNLRSVKNYTNTGVTTTTDTGLGFTQFYCGRLSVVIFQGLNCVPQNKFFCAKKNTFWGKKFIFLSKKG
jgi:hypothetical protein